MLADVSGEALQIAVEQIHCDGGSAMGMVCDVRDFGQVQKVCDETIRAWGSIDVLVNCAGGSSARVFDCAKHFSEYPVEYLDWGIDVNLKGPLYFSRAVMGQMMRQRSGIIVLLGSIAGEEGNAFSVDYSAAKSALMNGVVKSLAQIGAEYGIRACTVSPGPVLTRKEMARMRTLLGRAADPQEIVDLILYLASDKAAFITGSSFMIDGGRSSMTV